MSTLVQRAQDYLQAGGFVARRAGANFLEFQRAAGGGEPERILLWADDQPLPASQSLADGDRAMRDQREAALLQAFETEMRTAPSATGYYLVNRRLGLSQKFVTEATRLLGNRGGIRVPIEFFDTAYKIDGTDARRARSVLSDMLTLSDRVKRVAQPFSIRRGLDPNAREEVEGDLVEYLETALLEPNQGPKLRFIDGGAGSGKTVAFNALVASLYREFIEAKKSRDGRCRPIVFLPDHIRGKQIGYIEDIVAAMAETDVADVASPAQFGWLLQNGFSLWMFDGLDEFYANSSDFFQYIDAALSAPGSQAQFIICTRHSLFSSSPQMRAFIERKLAEDKTVEIYELAPWTPNAWREMAWLELENGRSGAKQSARVNAFLSALDKPKEIAELARLPFYCRVLLDRFKLDGTLPNDEFDVLSFVIDRMIDREHSKKIFRWRDFLDIDVLSEAFAAEVAELDPSFLEESKLRATITTMLDTAGRELLMELIGGLAHLQRRTPAAPAVGAGFSVEDVRELFGNSYVAVDPTDPELKRLMTVVVRFAFFGPGRKAGTVDFTHPILGDYLAARYAAAMLQREAAAGGHDAAAQTALVARAIGAAEIGPQSVFLRYLAREARHDKAVRSLLERAQAHLGRSKSALGEALQHILR